MDVLVINLKTRPDRLNIFKKNCKIEKVKFKKIEAINGWELDRKKHHTISYNNRSLGRGEIGCYLSHYKCYEKKREGIDLLIFEDDGKPCLNFLWKLHDVKKHIPADWDVILLGTTTNYHRKYRNLGRLEQINDYCFKVNGDVYGLQGYIVNDKACNDLIDCKYPLDSPVDIKITNMGLNVYLVSDWLVNAINLGSDTQLNNFVKNNKKKKMYF